MLYMIDSWHCQFHFCFASVGIFSLQNNLRGNKACQNFIRLVPSKARLENLQHKIAMAYFSNYKGSTNAIHADIRDNLWMGKESC
jgi:hypothetical protein